LFKNRVYVSKLSLFVLITTILLFFTACTTSSSQSSTEDAIREGRYAGTTSQGMQIELWVEKIADQYVISKIRYKIDVSNSSGATGTQIWSEPSERSIPIQDSAFSGESTIGDITEILSGTFSGDTVDGELTLSMNHPEQGLGIVTGTITFNAVFSETAAGT